MTKKNRWVTTNFCRWMDDLREAQGSEFDLHCLHETIVREEAYGPRFRCHVRKNGDLLVGADGVKKKLLLSVEDRVRMLRFLDGESEE